MEPKIKVCILFAGVFLVLAAVLPAAAADVPRMTMEELKALLDSPDLAILDVRSGRDWSASEFKIKGSRRVDVKNIDSWLPNYRKDQTIVLYCA